MSVFYAGGDERLGSLRIAKAVIDVDPQTKQSKRTPGLSLKLERAWGKGRSSTEDGSLVETARAGPDIIDTDDISGENLAKLRAFFGKSWKADLEAWLAGAGVDEYGLIEGDPRPTQKLRVSMTRERYNAFIKSEGTKPVDLAKPSTAQKVTTGSVGMKR